VTLRQLLGSPLARATSLALLAASTALMAGCRGETSREPPIVIIRNMYDQPRYKIQAHSDYFADHRAMRPPVEGVIAREREIDPEVATGRLPDQSGYVLTIPKHAVDALGGMDKLLVRGKERYNIFCAPCHDATGSGNGEVVAHAVAVGAAVLKPPTYHQDRLRHSPDGQLFATISNGLRNMPAYGYQIPTNDRWAIVGYVRALQVSQASVGEQSKL
jgi:mono/diheme cytochrome c family protein